MSELSDSSEAKQSFGLLYLQLLGVVIIWGANVVMIKYLTNYFSPSVLAALRLTTATLLLVPLVYRRYGWVKLPWQEWLPITGIAICCITFHQLTLSWGLATTSGTHAVLILALNPLFTTTLAARFADEPFTLSKILGVILGLSGIFFIITENGISSTGSLWGDLLIFIAMLLYVIGTLCVKKSTATIPPLVVTAYSHIIGSLGLVLIAALTAPPTWILVPLSGIIPISIFICSAWGATAVGALIWNTSIQRVGASTSSLFLNISPVIGIVASALFLHELLTWHHFVALLLVLTGVGMGTGILPRSVSNWFTQETQG